MVRSTSGQRFAESTLRRVRRWLFSLGLGLALSAVLAVLAGSALFHLPAAALSPVVGAMTGDQVRLALAVGTLGSGRGELWVRDAARREWRPWMPVDWLLTPVWGEAGPGLALAGPFAGVRLDRAGLAVSRVRLHLPPDLLMRTFDHPLAKAPWRGDIELSAERLSCPWSGVQRPTPVCDGRALLRWQGMASAVVPIPELGSFVAAISADSRGEGRWRAELSTERGVIEVAGYAELRRGALKYRIGINGAATLLADLDNIVGAGGYRRGETGEFILQSAR